MPVEPARERAEMHGDSTTTRGRHTGRRAFLAGLGALATGTAALGAGAARANATSGHEEQAQIPYRGSHRVLWSVETERPLVALTFDDGPDPRLTPRILDVLAEHGARATFFMMGHNATTHPGLAREVVAAGHEVANHTATHLDLSREPSEVVRAEIADGAAQVEAATGETTRWFRPPRGQLSAWSIRFAALTGHDTVMWSHSRGMEGTADDVAANLARVAQGEIVVLHDGCGRGTFQEGSAFAADLLRRRQVELDALPRALEAVRARGLELVTVSELVAAETATTG